METKQRVGFAVAGIAYVIMGILGAIIHVWTIVIAYAISGLFGAVLSLIFVGLAQLYWGIKIWNVTGTLWNNYCLALIAYVGLLGIVGIGAMMAGSE